MLISKIRIQNFKCVEDRTFLFHPRFTVIFGINGSGKTSILEALSIALSAWTNGISNQDSRSISKSEVRSSWSKIGERDFEKPFFPVVLETSACLLAQDICWEQQLEGTGGRTRLKTKAFKQLLKDTKAKIEKGDQLTLPLVSFYGPGRLWQEPNFVKPTATKAPQDYRGASLEDKIEDQFTSRLTGYRYSVDPRSNSREMLYWMRYMRRLEVDRGEKLQELQAVFHAIGTMLPDCEQVRFDLSKATLLFDFPNGRTKSFSQMSDGFRNAAALVGDLAWKACQLNPHLMGHALLDTPGVVLIDELDLHLHPEWQRRIGADLQRVFPKCQFIATSHSPQVLGELLPEQLISLDRDAVPSMPSESFGRDSNWILQYLMRTKSRHAALIQQLKDLNELMDEANWEKARALSRNLRETYGPDPDIIEADAAIDRWSVG